jgi:formate/nitrite transporter FocA (FNT family)
VSRRISPLELLRAWGVIYAGNFLGATVTGGMAVIATLSVANGQVIGTKATAVAAGMAELNMVETFFAGLLGNVLVCLAVWISYSGRTTTDRIIAVTFPVTAFYVLQLEHVIATMFYFPFAFFHGVIAETATVSGVAFPAADGTVLGVGAFLAHLIPVTVGNIVGGGVLVGAVYWFIYLRGRDRPD